MDRTLPNKCTKFGAKIVMSYWVITFLVLGHFLKPHPVHWLRVPERITFKLASLVFRCLNGTAPVYLADSLNRAADVGTRRSLRSSSSTAVVVPVTRRSTIGDRAFPVAAARAWNSLLSFVTSSSSLSTFKRHLKTYLFATSYWWRCWPCFFLCLPNMSYSLCVTCPCSFFGLNAALIFSLIIIIIIIIIIKTFSRLPG